MAVLQSTDELEEYIGNKYSLVIVAAKRARQLKEGHPALAHDESPNPLSIALREIQEHQVSSLAPPEEEIAPAPRDEITSLAGLDFDIDEELDLDEGDAVDDLAALLVGGGEEEEERAPRGGDILATADEDAEELNADVEEGGDDDEDEDEEEDTSSADASDEDEA